MITYNDIYEAARKERYSDQLQSVTKNFITDVAEYLRDKKQLTLKDDDVFSDMITKTKKQLENAVTLFKELMVRRRKKILNLVLIASETGISKQDFENMLPFEKSLFEEIMTNIEISDKEVNELLSGKKEVDGKHELVIFKENVEELLDLEGEKMGPFEEGQVANIPKEVAKILLDDKRVELMEK
ncbi:MAG: hypothetical protein KJ879_03055 [Nanoarchaeota archaeon]|nr:hypothetical protein [Nanoarchaeota archaeon]